LVTVSSVVGIGADRRFNFDVVGLFFGALSPPN
jgi:hypothetical protein